MQHDLEWWAKHGIVGGILAGITFAVFEMILATWTMGSHAVFMPMRMIGALVLGKGALTGSSSVLVAGVTGTIIHLMFSALFGVVFALVAWLLPVVRETPASLLASASAYGLLLWGINFFVFAPWAGWGWFPLESVRWVPILAHTFMFGTVLGIYFAVLLIHPPRDAIRFARMEPRKVA